MINLLIADDETAIRQGLLSLEWNEIGVRVAGAAKDGIEAWEIIQSEMIDILLLDIRMPGMNGMELLRLMAENGFEVKVILLSGHGEFEYAREAISFGVFEYLLKPTDPDEIFTCVGLAIEELKKERKKNERMLKLEMEVANQRLVQNSGNYSISDSDEGKDVIEDILEYIFNHYQEDISLSTLAEKINFTTIYLSRIIKKETGYSFLKVLTSLRMFHAVNLLKTTGYKINEISDRIGIKDQRYFSQVFKKTYGVTPNEFRSLDNTAGHEKRNDLVLVLYGRQYEKSFE